MPVLSAPPPARACSVPGQLLVLGVKLPALYQHSGTWNILTQHPAILWNQLLTKHQ
jgi:hypothetical protein